MVWIGLGFRIKNSTRPGVGFSVSEREMLLNSEKTLPPSLSLSHKKKAKPYKKKEKSRNKIKKIFFSTVQFNQFRNYLPTEKTQKLHRLIDWSKKKMGMNFWNFPHALSFCTYVLYMYMYCTKYEKRKSKVGRSLSFPHFSFPHLAPARLIQ